MSRPLGSVDIETVLDDIVEQFADPYAFYRELVQNAIDAGTGRVEVGFEYDGEALDAGSGRAVLEVRDFGEGMDRRIIEEELVRLFRSGKDEDYTKIGRFGIGFVSVFAIEPDLVCVDTGRSGEYWRILFDGEPSYELVELDRPVEGTSVRIFKEVGREEFDRMRERSRRALGEWCRHAEVPVLVEGEDLRESFEVDAPCTASLREEQTRISAGLVSEQRAPYGYYNSGLTLEEGRGSRWPHVAFKIDSRYLEHTVARDGVVEDENFHKAIDRLERVVDEVLPRELLEALERAAAAAEEPRRERSESYGALAGRLASYLRHYGEPSKGWRERAVVPAIGSEPATPDEIREAHEGGAFFAVVGEADPCRYAAELLVTPAATANGGTFALLEAVLGERPPRVREHFARPSPVELGDSDAARALCSELQGLLREVAATPQSIECSEIGGQSPVARDAAIVLETPGAAVPFDELVPPTLDNLPGRHLRLNVSHPAVRRALEVAPSEPLWAAYSLAKVLTAGELAPRRDLAWVGRLSERREPPGSGGA